MEQTNPSERAVQEAHEEAAEEHIHLPPPSWAPIILALGMAGVTFGLAFGVFVLAIGVVLLLVGLGMWVYDEIKHAAVADAEASHSNGTT